jgi:hypothetical protein
MALLFDLDDHNFTASGETTAGSRTIPVCRISGYSSTSFAGIFQEHAKKSLGAGKRRPVFSQPGQRTTGAGLRSGCWPSAGDATRIEKEVRVDRCSSYSSPGASIACVSGKRGATNGKSFFLVRRRSETQQVHSARSCRPHRSRPRDRLPADWHEPYRRKAVPRANDYRSDYSFVGGGVGTSVP